MNTKLLVCTIKGKQYIKIIVMASSGARVLGGGKILQSMELHILVEGILTWGVLVISHNQDWAACIDIV